MAYDSLLRTEGRSKLSTDLLQVDCQNLLSTGLLQVVSTSCNQSANDNLVGTSLILPDMLQLVGIDVLQLKLTSFLQPVGKLTVKLAVKLTNFNLVLYNEV